MKILLAFMLLSSLSFAKTFEVIKNNDLKKYCTDCHFVYQAGFLPQRSWKKLFQDESLKNHFGKEVIMSKEIQAQFLDYYLKQASDVSKRKASKKINKSISPNATPIKISTLDYVKDKHEDLKDEMSILNPKVKSTANCTACHKDKAKEGIYDEDEVSIPDYKKGFFGWSKK